MSKLEPETKRRAPRAGFLAALGFALAGGIGYYAWNLRTEGQATDRSLEHEKAVRIALQSDLEAARDQNEELSREIAACQVVRKEETAESAGLEASLAAVKADLKLTSAEIKKLRADRRRAKARLAAFNELTARFRKMIDAGKLKVKVRDGRMIVELPARVLFPSGSADLSEDGRRALMEVAIILRDQKGHTLMVAGHTDSRPVGKIDYEDNWELSTARAVNVTRFLIESGLDPDDLVAAGYGQHDPIASNRTRRGRQRNRRIEIVLLPNVSGLPPLLKQLQAAKRKNR